MKKSIGIDLGTTNSVIAFKDTSVKIVRNKENEELTRSCVGLVNDEIVVGSIAYRLIERDPINTILSVKRGCQRQNGSGYDKEQLLQLWNNRIKRRNR